MLPSRSMDKQQQQAQDEREQQSNGTSIHQPLGSWGMARYQVRELVGHKDGVTCLQVDETLQHVPFPILATASWDRTVKIWNLNAGECITTLRGHKRGVRCLWLDGECLVSGGMGGDVKFWNWKTGECMRTLEAHNEAVLSVRLQNGTPITASGDSTIKIWNTSSRATDVPSATLQGHAGWVNCITSRSADGQDPSGERMLVSGADDGCIKIWDLDTHQCDKTIDAHNIDPIQGLKFLPASDGDERMLLVSASLDHTLKVWDIMSGSCLATLSSHTEHLWSLDANAEYIVSASNDKTVNLWDRKSFKCVRTFIEGSEPVLAVTLGKDKIIAGCANGDIRIWTFQL